MKIISRSHTNTEILDFSDISSLDELASYTEHYKLIKVINLERVTDSIVKDRWSATFIYECTVDNPDYIINQLEKKLACTVEGYHKHSTYDGTIRYSFLVFTILRSIEDLKEQVNKVKCFTNRVDISIVLDGIQATERVTIENENDEEIIYALEKLALFINDEDFDLSNQGNFNRAAEFIEILARYLGFRHVIFGSKNCRNNTAAHATNEIMFGTFDNLEHMLIALFHETGHRLAPQEVLDKYDSKLMKEAIAWVYGINRARQLGIQFSDDAINYAINQLKTYVGHDKRETRTYNNKSIRSTRFIWQLNKEVHDENADKE